MLPSARPKTSAPRTSLSRLITTACTLAVYASQLGLPHYTTQDSLPVGGQPLPGRIRTYWVYDEGFQALSIAYPFLPSQAWPGARDVSTTQHRTLRLDAQGNVQRAHHAAHRYQGSRYEQRADRNLSTQQQVTEGKPAQVR